MPQTGGKSKTLSLKDRDGRSFKAVNAKSRATGKYTVSARAELKDNSFRIYGKTAQGKPKSVKPTPESAAKKVLKRLCEEAPKNSACRQDIVLMETTRGGRSRLYFYEGHRKKLAKPRVSKFPDGRTVTFHYDHAVKSVPESKLGHSNPLSGWKTGSNK